MSNITGKTISFMRIMCGYSQRELSEKAGISFSSVRRYESGERTPTLFALAKIAEALNTTVLSLIDFKDKKLVLSYLEPCMDELIARTHLTPQEIEEILFSSDTLRRDEIAICVEQIYHDRKKKNENLFLTQNDKSEETPIETTISFEEVQLLELFAKFNDLGKQVALNNLRDLTEIPRYQKEE